VELVFEEVENEGVFAGSSLGHELVGVGVGSADDDLALPVREELVGCVPTARRECLGGGLHPVVGAVCSARRQAADLTLAFAIAARLHQGAIGRELAGGAPGIGLHPQRAHPQRSPWPPRRRLASRLP
jgi:hypothetical protein